MRDCLEHWTQAEVVPRDLRMNLHHENIALGLAADQVLPAQRVGKDHYPSHLQFARFLLTLPDQGAVFTRRADLIGPAYRMTVKAIEEGYLQAEINDMTGKTIIKPTEKLEALVYATRPTDEEVINS